jgi:hypothetical protein
VAQSNGANETEEKQDAGFNARRAAKGTSFDGFYFG